MHHLHCLASRRPARTPSSRQCTSQEQRCAEGTASSARVINALDVPDKTHHKPLPAVDTRCGTPSPDHDQPTWSKQQIQSAAKDHVVFTYGPTDAQRDAVPLLRSGEGSYLYDDDGKQYLDWTSQAVCANLGHTVPPSVKAAVAQQLDTLPYVYGGLGLVEPRARLASLLSQVLPGDLNGFISVEWRRGERGRDSHRAAVHGPVQDPDAV